MLFVLGIVVLAAVVVIDVAILFILSRQKRDQLAMRRILAAIANYTVAIEHDQRKTRHAVKDLAVTLRMQSVAAALEEPPTPLPVIALERLERLKDEILESEEEYRP